MFGHSTLRKNIINKIDSHLIKYLQKNVPSRRPGLSHMDSYSAGNIVPSLGIAYYLENEVSIFSTCVLKLSQEMFRNGFSYEPAFTVKCSKCGTVYNEAVEECNVCGSSDLNEPDPVQMFNFESSKRSFKEKANYNGQSLREVLKDFENNLNIADNAYLLLIKSYEFERNGEILASQPKELISVDPRTIKKVVQRDGRMGGKYYVCPVHRSEQVSNEEGYCPICKAKLQDVHYETVANEHKQYYLKDEVFHCAKYYPSILYGYPPALKMMDILMAYHFLEKRTRGYYERGRPPGIIMVPSHNQASLDAMVTKLGNDMDADPYHLPFMAFDTDNKAGPSFLKLLDDPNDSMLGVKQDLRERISAYFGVSLIFQGDTSTSGGLNNEGLQVTVTNRAVEDGQTIYNDKLFPWLFDQFGITDFKLIVNPSEEQDEMAEKQRQAQDISNARGMYDMGFDVEFVDGAFVFSGEATPAGERNTSALGMPSMEEPPESSGTPVKKSFDVDSGDYLVKDFFTDALEAIAKGALYSYYADATEQDVQAIHGILKDQFKAGDISLSTLTQKIMEATGFDAARSEMIARTETSAVTMKARELGWKKLEAERGEPFLFRTSEANDARVSDTSKLIAAKVASEGGAVTLDRLKQIYKEVSQRPINQGGMGASWTGWENFVAHPNERSTIVRVVR